VPARYPGLSPVPSSFSWWWGLSIFYSFFGVFCWFILRQFLLLFLFWIFVNFYNSIFYLFCLPLSFWDIKGEYFIAGFYTIFTLCPFETKIGSIFCFGRECIFKTSQVIFVPEWPKGEFVSLCWLHSVWQNHYLVKLQSLSGMLYILESSFHKSCSRCSRKILIDSYSEKSNPKFPSGRPIYASGRPSLLRSWTIQGYIHPNVMATCSDAL